MAVIYNGLIISTRKSAGGMNFYKRNGVQCLRNKPVRSTGYKESAAQAQQNSVFSLVSAFKNNAVGMEPLIRGGWGASVRGKGRTAFNNWSSEVLKAVTRDEAGNLLVGEARAESIAAFTTNPGKVFRERCPLVKSKYPALGEGATATITGEAGSKVVTLTIPTDVVDAWKAQLPTSYQNAADVTGDVVYLTSPDLAESITVPFFTATPTISGASVTVSFSGTGLEAGNEIRFAYGAAPAAVGDFGRDSDYAFGDGGSLIAAAGA